MAHLIVHSVGVIIFFTKPTNTGYYLWLWGVFVLLLANIQLQVSTRMCGFGKFCYKPFHLNIYCGKKTKRRLGFQNR